MAEFGVTGCWLDRACKKADIPLIVHFHGYDASVSSVLKTHEDDYVRLFGSASAIIAVSRSMKQRLIELGAPMHKVHVSPCGVDQSSFLPCRPADQPPHFLAVGRFVEKKAPYLTILSFSLVAKENPEVVLVMIGDGPLLGPCKRLVQALGLSDRVHLLGSRGPHDVISYLQSSRAFLQHSLEAENGDCEGTPVAVVEAQMSGIPVIATRHAGIPDVVVDGTTGFLVEEADVQGMAAAIKRLAQNPQLAGEMGTLARKRALENFSLDQHISQLATVIQAAIDR
jgi:glycosyltransferase involved in cell wall biosynthesis